MTTDDVLLALETSCDETAAAVIRRDRTVLSSVVASQFELHQPFGGVVPEIASRAHVPRLLPVLEEALRQAGVRADQLAAVAVTSEPGLVGSLLVGMTAARTLALSLEIPLVTVNHVHAHLYACTLNASEPAFPAVGLVVSGGHTHLFDCQSATEYQLLGGTLDDAAGEAFDKTARILGLSYPGGPSIQKAAESGDAARFRLPRPMRNSDQLTFSFSGLKTAVLYAARGVPGPEQLTETPADRVADLAAGFQQAVVDVLINRCQLAVKRTGRRTLCVGGGVAANRLLRQSFQAWADRDGLRLLIPPMEYCTDNAAMAAMAWEHLERGEIADLSADVRPGLIRFHGA